MQETLILSLSAASLGLIHTLVGPDHYLPFVAIAKARKLSLLKSGILTFICGLGHIMGSVVLGLIGIAFGLSIGSIEIFDSIRADIVAWLLISFGLVYMSYGIRRANHKRYHTHVSGKKVKKPLTPWILFIIFLFGPCEPLIPLLIYPAAQQSFFTLLMVISAFAFTTLLTMLAMVYLGLSGLRLVPIPRLERYSHALAGATISLCGSAIFLGL